MRSIRVLDRSLKPLLMLVAIAATSFFGSAATVHAADSAVWIDDTSFKFTSGSSSATFEQVGQMESGGTDFIVFAKDGELPSEDEECMGTPIYGFNAKDTYIYSARALNNTVGESGALDSCGYVFDTKVIEITGDVKDTPKVGGLNDEYINGEIYRQCPDLKTDSNTKKLKGFGKKRSEAIITITTNLKPDASPLLEGGYDVCATLAGFLKNPKWLDGDLTKHLVENEGEEELVETTSCAVDGIGWVVCPVLTFIGRMNDAAFTFLQNILGIQPAVVGSEATRNAWSAFRDIANVAFVIAFMVIVYSQITSAGISNYGIKKLLPRIVVAAILVNVSFYICAIAVDISNIVGASIFTLLKDSIDVGSEIETTQWESSVGNILGIAATGIGVVLLVVALTMAPAVLLAFVLIILILIARQALIILLIVVSPLAFVAYLLPNTEDWFKKWWKAFVATLMVYPIVGLVFGASTLASSILVQVGQGGDPEDDQQLLMLIALGVAAVPLFAIPAILKGSLSAAGSIGTKISGLADRSTRMSGRQFGDRSKQYAGGAANAVRRRAMSGQGAFGRQGWRSGFGLGVGGVMRGTAKRNDKYKNLEDRAKSQTETFLSSDPNSTMLGGRVRRTGAAERRRLAEMDKETAEITVKANRDEAKIEHLEQNGALHTRGTETKLRKKDIEGAHEAQATTGYMAGEGRVLNIQRQVAEDQLGVTKARNEAEIQEMRSTTGAARAVGTPLAGAAASLNASDMAKRAETQRAASATGVATVDYATQVRASEGVAGGLAEVAGSIDTYGSRRAISAATQVEVEQFNKNVSTEKATMTSLPERRQNPGDPDGWLDIVMDETQSHERRAAAAGKVMQGGSMGAIHDLYNYTMTMDATNPAQTEARQNIQMQMGGDLSRNPFGQGDRDRSALVRGELTAANALAGIPAARSSQIQAKIAAPTDPANPITYYDAMLGKRGAGKMSPEALVGLDPDDRKRYADLIDGTIPDGGLVVDGPARTNLVNSIRAAAANEKTKGVPKTDAKNDYNRILIAMGEPPMTDADWL